MLNPFKYRPPNSIDYINRREIFACLKILDSTLQSS